MVTSGKFVRENRLVVSLHFANKHISNNLPELYLFLKLRLYSSTRGGKYFGFKFTKNELYNILPKIEKLGWVRISDQSVVKYRKILNNCGLKSTYSFSIDEYSLASLRTFKGFMLAVNEQYFLKKGFSSLKSGLSDNSVRCVSKSNEDEVSGFSGRVFNSELSSIMGVSIPTISRWRKESSDCGFNEYSLKTYIKFSVSLNKQTFPTYIEKRFDIGRCHGMRSDKRSLVTKDLVITSSLNVFCQKSLVL